MNFTKMYPIFNSSECQVVEGKSWSCNTQLFYTKVFQLQSNLKMETKNIIYDLCNKYFFRILYLFLHQSQVCMSVRTLVMEYPTNTSRRSSVRNDSVATSSESYISVVVGARFLVHIVCATSSVFHVPTFVKTFNHTGIYPTQGNRCTYTVSILRIDFYKI